MRIKKVKLTNEKKILIVYEKPNKIGGWDEYSMTCLETARPGFYEALEALGAHVIEMCELPASYQSKISVRGVTFSYSGEDEVLGATISAAMELNHSYPALNLNTPHKTTNSADEMQNLTGPCQLSLGRLIGESKIYIDGDRAQARLFAVNS